MKKEIFIIIDGHALIHRAYHALPPLTTDDGTPVHAVYGFFSMLLKVLNDLKPKYLAVSFDVGGKTFRDEVYSEYKATRVRADDDLYSQIPLIQETLKRVGIPLFLKEGFEADDVIGTIVTTLGKKHKDLDCIVVTGDKDLLQLVTENIHVYLLRKGMSDFTLFDIDEVQRHFGFGPERVVDYKAFRGDSSDNIPGIRGIGEKTAKIIIDSAKTLDDVYKQVAVKDSAIQQALSPRMLEKLKEGENDAYMSRELAQICCDVDGLDFNIDNTVTSVIDYAVMGKSFREFGFHSLVKRLPGEPVEKSTKKHMKVVRVGNDQKKKFFSILESVDICGCKEIVDGNSVSGTLQGFVFVFEEKGIYYIDMSFLTKEEKEKLFSYFTKEKHTVVAHDIKKLVKVLLRNNIQVQAVLFDLMIASYIINASTRAHDLSAILLRELDIHVGKPQAQQTLFGVDIEDVVLTYQYVFSLFHHYEKELEDMGNRGLFDHIEMALIPVLAKMELAGVELDSEYLGELSKNIAEELAELTKNIYEEAGKEFNIASSQQLREILFVDLALPTAGIKKGKTGYSTAANELEKLREYHPIISFIEKYRELAKLQNTYVDVLPTLVNKKTGRLHTTFNQAVTTTGRLSSSDPNLQNIPIRSQTGKKIRNAFIAAPGYVLIAADYSQVELRVIASLAKDKNMIDIFKKDEDIHKATAAIIHQVPIDEVTAEMRSAAKQVNFGVLYGMGAYGLASRTGLPVEQAREFIDAYFSGFSSVKKYLDIILEQAKKDGYVETLFGRRRYIPELKARNHQIRTTGERMAINMPVQGTAADMMKMAMIVVHKKIQAFGDDVRMLLQVHDEIVMEVKKGKEKEVGKILQKEMEDVIEMNVPVKAEVHTGKHWGKLK